MKKLSNILIGCALALPLTTDAQQFRWAKNGGSVDAGPLALTERVQNMASDAHGNIYVTSPVYRNNISVAGTPLPDGHDYQFTDGLLTSVDCNGNHRWSKIIGGTNGEEAPFVAVSPGSQNYVYLAGYVSKNNATPINFDTDSTLSAQGMQSIFIAQYDTLGDMKWLRMLQADTVANWSFSRTQMMGIDVDTQGNVYAMCKFPPNSALGGSSLTIPPGPNDGMYILKYSPQGQLQSVTKLDMTFNNSGTMIMCMRRHPQTGNYYINGGLVPFAPYNDVLYLGANQMNTMAYLACYNPAGQLLWFKQNTYTAGLNNTRLQEEGVHFDAAGDVYIAGQGADGDAFNGFSFNHPLGNNVSDVQPFVMKMNQSGALTWISTGYGNPFSSTTKMTLNNNNVAIGGAYGNLLVWGADSIANPVGSGQDGWVAILDKATGTIQHLDVITGPATYDGVTDLHYHKNDLYLGGYFQSSLNAGTQTAYNNGGSSDFFIVKYGYPCNCITPVAAFTKQNNGSQYQFTNTTTATIDSLRWYFGDGQSSTQPTPTHNYTASGTYTVSLVVHSACGKDSTTQTLQVTVGIGELSYNNGIVLYPNPANDQLYIENAGEATELLCFDVVGQFVLQQPLKAGKNTIIIDHLKPGMYQVRLRHRDGRNSVERLIKL